MGPGDCMVLDMQLFTFKLLKILKMLKLWSYLKPCQTTLSMLSSEKVSCYRISVNYFRKKAPLQMFDLFITTPLLTILHDSLLRTTFCRKERLKSKV